MQINYKGIAIGEDAKAVIAFSKGNYKDAIAIWESILERSPANTAARKGIVSYLLTTKNYKEALHYLKEGLPYAARDPELYNMMALCYLKEGKIDVATDTILDALEQAPSELLLKTLENIRQLKNPIHARNMSILPLLQITLPAPNIKKPSQKKSSLYLTVAVILGIVILLYLGYPMLQNLAVYLNFRNRDFSVGAVKREIKNIDQIINARSNFNIILDETGALQKFKQLKQAIHNQHHNKAHILVNELLESNVGDLVKERVRILESLIVDPNINSIDYIPEYKEIAISPSVYKDILIRWPGIVVNVNHQGRKKTTFDLLINGLGQGKVDGIANVEIQGYHALYKGSRTTIIGTVDGITPDNRINIHAKKIIPNTTPQRLITKINSKKPGTKSMNKKPKTLQKNS